VKRDLLRLQLRAEVQELVGRPLRQFGDLVPDLIEKRLVHAEALSYVGERQRVDVPVHRVQLDQVVEERTRVDVLLQRDRVLGRHVLREVAARVDPHVGRSASSHHGIHRHRALARVAVQHGDLHAVLLRELRRDLLADTDVPLKSFSHSVKGCTPFVITVRLRGADHSTPASATSASTIRTRFMDLQSVFESCIGTPANGRIITQSSHR